MELYNIKSFHQTLFYIIKFLYLSRYAREDTHYLLYIYDLMRAKLSSLPKESENSDAPLVEVYTILDDDVMLIL